jgi:putative ABC transport system ATP-binding protein
MIDNPDRGQYHFGDLELSKKSEEELVEIRKDNIGFIFQSFNLINSLTVYENVEVPLLYKNIPTKRRKVLVREALELVDLNNRANHKPQQLSGGQQQRVAVARSVVTDPKLILADEPTGNLDSKHGEEIMDMLEVLKGEGATILMVTHSPGFSQRADRVIHMMDGRIVESPRL